MDCRYVASAPTACRYCECCGLSEIQLGSPQDFPASELRIDFTLSGKPARRYQDKETQRWLLSLDKQPSRVSWTRDQLAAYFAAPLVLPYTMAEYAALDKVDQTKYAAKAANGYCIGRTYSKGRKAEDITSATFLMLDFDEQLKPELIAPLLDAYKHLDYIAYPTAGYKPNAPRYRIILPLAKPVTSREEFEFLAHYAGDIYDHALLDKVSFEWNQITFAPVTPKDVDYAQLFIDNRSAVALSPRQVFEQYPSFRDKSTWPAHWGNNKYSTALIGNTKRDSGDYPFPIGSFNVLWRHDPDAFIERCAIPWTRVAPEKYEPGYAPGRGGIRWHDSNGFFHVDHNQGFAEGQHPTTHIHGNHHAFNIWRKWQDHKAGKTWSDEESFANACSQVLIDFPALQVEFAKNEFDDLDADKWLELPTDPLAPALREAVPAERIIVPYTKGRAVGSAHEILIDTLNKIGPSIGMAVYGDKLVCVADRSIGGFGDKNVESVELVPYQLQTFVAALNKGMKFVSRTKDKDGTMIQSLADCPDKLANSVLGAAHLLYDIEIERIAATPILRGTELIFGPGYDKALKAWIFAPKIEVAATPTKADATAALGRLKTWLAEFPFDSAEDLSAALCAMLTAAMRASLGFAPGFCVTKPDYGSGASTLCDLIHVILVGRPAPVINASKGRVEVDKEVDSAQYAGRPSLVLDNIPDGQLFNSMALVQTLSQERRQLRILGKTFAPVVPCRQMVLLNGNNVRVGDDLTRRCLMISLDPNREDPYRRTFKRPRLIEEARDARPQMLADLYTLVMAYQAAGEQAHVKMLAGFEQWRRLVVAPLVWLGEPDPIRTQEALIYEDPAKTQLHTLFHAWYSLFGNREVTGRDVISTALALDEHSDVKPEHLEARFELKQILDDVCRNKRGDLDTRILGEWLSGRRKRVVDGCRINTIRQDRNKVAKWTLHGKPRGAIQPPKSMEIVDDTSFLNLDD